MFLIKKNKVIIKFRKEFYSQESIQETKLEYKKICAIRMHHENKHIYVELTPFEKTSDLKKLALEFSNYTLSMQ